MNIFNVYPLFDIEIEKGEGSYVWDTNGTKYLDLYGGHAVISIGHTHPHYVEKITNQLSKIGFYSNSIQIPQQKQLADKLIQLSGKEGYQLFFCNSGAEANENALKLASFSNGKKKVISFSKGFHGRTSLAVAVTDNKNIVAPVNETENSLILPFNDEKVLEKAFQENEISSVIIEGIQGIGGIYEPTQSFIEKIKSLCTKYNAVYIADSVQCGYGRSGKFFSHDYYGIDADIYTMAKGMGNGFPIGGVLISPKFEAKFGMLGTTFGGNHLASAAGIAVLEVLEKENLIENAAKLGAYTIEKLKTIKGIKEVRGKGLMIGIELFDEAGAIRSKLLKEYHIFTGSASNKNTIRLLPALNVNQAQIDEFIKALDSVLNA